MYHRLGDNSDGACSLRSAYMRLYQPVSHTNIQYMPEHRACRAERKPTFYSARRLQNGLIAYLLLSFCMSSGKFRIGEYFARHHTTIRWAMHFIVCCVTKRSAVGCRMGAMFNGNDGNDNLTVRKYTHAMTVGALWLSICESIDSNCQSAPSFICGTHSRSHFHSTHKTELTRNLSMNF